MRDRSAGACSVRAGLGERFMDVLEGGPKLRKWYGGKRGEQEEGKAANESSSCPAEPTMRVSNGRSSLGEAVAMQLVLEGEVPEAGGIEQAECKRRFGPYVVSSQMAQGAKAGTAVLTGMSDEEDAKWLRGQSGIERVAFVARTGERTDRRLEAIQRASADSLMLLLGGLEEAKGGAYSLELAHPESGAPAELGKLAVEDAASLLVATLGGGLRWGGGRRIVAWYSGHARSISDGALIEELRQKLAQL